MKKILTTLILFCFYVAQGAHGASIIQKFAAVGESWDIEDSYDTDTTADYGIFYGSGTVTVSGGVLRTTSYNLTANAYHETNLGSDEMTVQGVVCWGDTNGNGSGLSIRSDGVSSGHACIVNATSSRFDCFARGGGTAVYLAWTGTWAANTCYLARISVNGSDLYELFVDWNDDGDFDDANEVGGTDTDSSFTGTYAGPSFKYSAVLDDIYVDDFKARAN